MTRPTTLSIVVAIAIAVIIVLAGTIPAAAGPEPIFLDGFESGDVCGWSSRSPIYVESFGLADGSPLPGVWTIVGGLELADIQQGRARLRPVPSTIAPGRVVADIPTMDVDVRFTFWMEDVSRQGVGFYVRQNGGYLGQTVPSGEGYAVFLEGFFGGSRIGLWREVDGIEEPLGERMLIPLSFADGEPYRARLRVNQMTPTETLLQAKVWPLADPEPAAWTLTRIDGNSPSLQNVEAGIALDVFTLAGAPGSPSGYFDDITLEALCNPLAAR